MTYAPTTTTIPTDYDLYCHYVAGLVGEGLSRLFAGSGLESPLLLEVAGTLANTVTIMIVIVTIIVMIVNNYNNIIIRWDCFYKRQTSSVTILKIMWMVVVVIIDDYNRNNNNNIGRSFWPKDIWSLYTTTTGDLGDFCANNKESSAVSCLNHLVNDALYNNNNNNNNNNNR